MDAPHKMEHAGIAHGTTVGPSYQLRHGYVTNELQVLWSDIFAALASAMLKCVLLLTWKEGLAV